MNTMITLTHDEKIKMIEAMRLYGGGFISALAECFLLADEVSLNRLYEAFPEYVERYRELASRTPGSER